MFVPQTGAKNVCPCAGEDIQKMDGCIDGQVSTYFGNIVYDTVHYFSPEVIKSDSVKDTCSFSIVCV